jgi:predicted Zn-dependent peptidase
MHTKEEISGRHKVGLSTTSGTADAIFAAALAGRPVSFVDQYPSIIEALSLAEVNRAIKEHIRYDLAVTAAAGAIDQAGHPLA